MDLDNLFNERDVRPKPVAPPPPPTGLSRSDMLTLRTAAGIAKKPGRLAAKAGIVRQAAKVWREKKIWFYVLGHNGETHALDHMAEAVGRLIALGLIYDAHPAETRCASPTEPAKAVTIGKRGLTIAASISEGGELVGDGRTVAAVRRKIVTAVLEAERAWAKTWPAAARRLRALRAKDGGGATAQPVNLAAVVVEPQQSKAERKAISGFIRRLSRRSPQLAKLLSSDASSQDVETMLKSDEPLTLQDAIRKLCTPPPAPSAAPEQRAEP